MEITNKSFFIVSTILIILIIASIIFSTARAELSSQETELEECSVLAYNNENSINILFISPNQKEAEEYSNFLFNVEPFKDNKNSFNAFFINTKPECELYKKIALFCHNRETIKKSASCPEVDLIVALGKEKPNIRSSSYLNVMSINTAQNKNVLVHELGHALGKLDEEYITNSRLSASSPNCLNYCSDFEMSDGCYDGCTKTTFKRSIEEGVMRTLSTSYYGIHNINYLKTVVDKRAGDSIKITGKAVQEIQNCESEEYILLKLKNSGNLALEEKQLLQGCYNGYGNGDLVYDVSAESGIFTGQLNFNIYTDSHDENLNLEGETFNGEEAYLSVPVGDNLQIKDSEGNLLLSETLEDAGFRPCLVK